MKKFLLYSIFALTAVCANAQKNVYLSTLAGTDLNKYLGKNLTVIMNRHIFNGWNTICFPFSMTESEVNEVFGSDCILETLTEVTFNNSIVNLYFSDVKSKGIEANKPYILHYSGETTSIPIRLENKELLNTDNSILINGVSFSGTQKHIDGLGYYGILAKDNQNATFVAVDKSLSGFYATRCYLNITSGSNCKVVTNHLSGATNISTITSDNTQNSEVYNLSGQKVSNMNKGVNIVNGKKVLVK